MTLSTKKLYGILSGLMIILALFLWREISAYRSITTQSVEEPLLAENPTQIVLSANDEVLGNPGAPLTVIEFADLNNSNSRTVHEIMSKFVTAHPLNIRLVFKHAPIPRLLLSDGTLAHQAAYCAGEQHKFWQFLDTLINKKYDLKESGLRQAAADVKLDLSPWAVCTNSEHTKSIVAADLAEAQKLGLGEPPLIFLNNRKLNVVQDVNIPELLSSLIAQ